MGKENPVQFLQLFIDVLGINHPVNKRDDPLLVLESMFNFFLTGLRNDPIRAEDKHEGTGSLNSDVDLFLPVGRRRNILPILDCRSRQLIALEDHLPVLVQHLEAIVVESLAQVAVGAVVDVNRVEIVTSLPRSTFHHGFVSFSLVCN